jgi:hypothetical protein
LDETFVSSLITYSRAVVVPVQYSWSKKLFPSKPKEWPRHRGKVLLPKHDLKLQFNAWSFNMRSELKKGLVFDPEESIELPTTIRHGRTFF